MRDYSSLPCHLKILLHKFSLSLSLQVASLNGILNGQLVKPRDPLQESQQCLIMGGSEAHPLTGWFIVICLSVSLVHNNAAQEWRWAIWNFIFQAKMSNFCRLFDHHMRAEKEVLFTVKPHLLICYGIIFRWLAVVIATEHNFHHSTSTLLWKCC